MKIFDSKSSKKINFDPLKEGKVSLYVCGMTVYDSCHIGHLRTFLSFDFIVKSFKALNYDIHYVRNITDVDDKIIAKAKSEKTSPSVISERYIEEMHEIFKYIKSNNLKLNAGHDLNLENLPDLIDLNIIDEVSIGHAIITESLIHGLGNVLSQYIKIIR